MEEILFKDKHKLYAAYLGCRIRLNETRFSEEGIKDRVFTLDAVRDNGFRVKETGIWYKFHDTRFGRPFADELILSPKSELRQKDALKIAMILGWYDGENIRASVKGGTVEGLVEAIQERVNTILNLSTPEVDYLRSEGYDCGYAQTLSLLDAKIAVKE